MPKPKLQGPRPLSRHLQSSFDPDNPPRSAAEALSIGVNQYINKNGELVGLRQIDNPRRQGSVPLSHGNVEKRTSRKANRGGGVTGTRVFNERLASPEGTDFAAANRAMAEANALGMDGDHDQDISRTAEGKRFKVQSGRGTTQEYDANFAKAGVPIGHTAANITPRPPEINRIVKPAELAALDAGILKVTRKSAIADILKARATKAAGKLIPGLDLAISAAEVAEYVQMGRFDQAALAGLSGIIGFVPGGGDLIAAGIDGYNGVLDVQRYDGTSAGGASFANAFDSLRTSKIRGRSGAAKGA